MASTMPLIITQLLTPKKRPDLLHRPRLVDFLHEHIDRKLLLISASAGYGKTSLLVDYAHDTDLPVCWLSAVESCRDPRVFLDYLIAAISLHFPQFGERSRQTLHGSETLSDPELTASTLVNEIYEAIPDYFVVAVDDYHLVDSSRPVNLVLDSLIQHLPENCHFIISSRAVPTLTPRGLAVLTARQQIAGLGVNDLRFTPQEIQNLLRQNYGQQVSDKVAHELAERSEGWITGILLTTHTMWKGLFEGMVRIQGSDSKVYDYLVNEVFDLQAPAVQTFLLFTSVLEEMSPLLCDEFLGTSNSRAMLKLLEDENLFISRLERGEERWYRYHQLFREFLFTRLSEDHPEQVRPLRQRAAQLLRERGVIEQAIRYHLLVGDYDDAVQAVLEVARETYDSGGLGTLAGWIDALPANKVQEQPRLLWFRAKVHLETGELDQANNFFDSAYELFAGLNDELGQAQTLVERSAVFRFRGAFREAIAGCEHAIALAQGTTERTEIMQVVASAFRQIGTCQASLGNLAAGEEQLRKALKAYEKLRYATNIAYVHLDLGAILQMAGNLVGAELHFRQALETWEKLGNIGLVALTINNMAIGHYYRGEYAEALQLYSLGLSQAQKAGLQRPTAFILAGIGDVHRNLGRYGEALQAYEEGLAAARQVREDSLLCYLLDAIGNTSRLMGDPARGVGYVRQALDRAQERDATYEVALYQTSLGVIHYQQGNVRQAEQYLVQSRDVFARSRAWRELAGTSLYLAQSYYVSGRLPEALASMQTVLNCLIELGYDGFLVPVARETRRVIEWAVARGMADTLVHMLLTRLDAPAEVGFFPPTQSQDVVVKSLLRVHAFGESRVLRGEQLITSSEWGMAKSKELLFYLLCFEQRRKDQIGNDLWPDLSPARLRSAFHVALYRLRRALDQQDCVQYEGEQYRFNRRINYWYDVGEFEQAIELGESYWSTDRAKAAQHYDNAVVLYTGDFMDDFSSSHDWCLVRREGLLQRYLIALMRLGECHASAGRYQKAIHFYEQALAKDSYQEGAHRGIMRCQALLGERSAALNTYHRLAELLEAELGADPSAESATLYEQILRGQVLPPPTP